MAMADSDTAGDYNGNGNGLAKIPEETTVLVHAAGDVNVQAEGDAVVADFSQKAVDLDNAALDSILSLNSFFTVAIFIGLGLPTEKGVAGLAAGAAAPPGACVLANPEGTKQTIQMLEIIAFACVLSSTLFAIGLKMVININTNSKKSGDDLRSIGAKRDGKHYDLGLVAFRACMVYAACALITALILLMLAMVYYVEIYSGPIHCSFDTRRSVIPLAVLTTLGLAFLLCVLALFIQWFQRFVYKCAHALKCTFTPGAKQPKQVAKDVESLISH